MDQPLVTPEDHDAGFKDVELAYRRGSPPDGSPSTIRLRALTWIETQEIARQAQKQKSETKQEDDWRAWTLTVLFNSLPETHNTIEFLNRLRPENVTILSNIASALAYGMPSAEQKKTAETPLTDSAPGSSSSALESPVPAS